MNIDVPRNSNLSLIYELLPHKYTSAYWVSMPRMVVLAEPAPSIAVVYVMQRFLETCWSGCFAANYIYDDLLS